MSKLTSNKSTAQEIESLKSLASNCKHPNVSAGIDKNVSLADYQNSCIAKGLQDQVVTAIKGKTSPQITYPSHYQLIANCKMKPSSNLYYQVKDLWLDNVIIFFGEVAQTVINGYQVRNSEESKQQVSRDGR